jgi:hypothetical protein
MHKIRTSSSFLPIFLLMTNRAHECYINIMIAWVRWQLQAWAKADCMGTFFTADQITTIATQKAILEIYE